MQSGKSCKTFEQSEKSKSKQRKGNRRRCQLGRGLVVVLTISQCEKVAWGLEDTATDLGISVGATHKAIKLKNTSEL